MEIIELKNVPREAKIALLNEFGFTVDVEDYILGHDGKRVEDKYTNDRVTLENFDLLPDKEGKPIIITDNVFSLVSYFEECGEDSKEWSIQKALGSSLRQRI